MYKNLDRTLLSGGILGTGKKYWTDEIIVGVDFPMLSRFPFYEGTEIRHMLDGVTEHIPPRSARYLSCLFDFSEKHPEFLFAKAKTLSLALHDLDSRAESWNRLSKDKQFALMEEFKKFELEY